jgi:DNA modification methylase
MANIYLSPSAGERRDKRGAYRSDTSSHMEEIGSGPPEIGPKPGLHLIWQADSVMSTFIGDFDLVLCSPPYFHPRKKSILHGLSPATRDIEEFAEWTAHVLMKTSRALKAGKPVCFVKTDVKYKRSVLPLGFRIAERSEQLGLRVLAHWIWQRLPYYSPYAPSISNIFVLGSCEPDFLRHKGSFESNDCRSRKLPSSFTPDLFEQLIRQLSKPNSCVLDPFVGLGSTVIAAKRCGRWSIGVELASGQIAKAKLVLSDIEDIEFRVHAASAR